MAYNDKLREERLQRGWTQKDVADRIKLPDSHTVGRWERGTIFPSPHYRLELCRIFGKSLEELDLLKLPIISPIKKSRSDEVFNKLPTTFNSFVGRKQEVIAVSALLKNNDVRLLTLLGSGGIGKTRLSIEVASQIQDQFADGICFVSLASLRDPASLLPTIGIALGIQDSTSYSPEQRVKNFLREKHVLLLIDNFEHFDISAPLLEDLLLDCHYIKVLVTSRYVLQLEAEHIFIVPPLSLPDLKYSSSVEELMHYAAVALFVQRVHIYLPSFKMTVDNARAISELCIHLDGLPLAIELAAARIKLFSPQTLLTRFLQDQQILESELRTIPERHRTLYHTIQWSYDLLNKQEQRLFRYLSVFAGGSSLNTIEELFGVTIPSSSIVKIVISLLNKSLLQRIEQDHGEPRFVMLETIRTYALKCLQDKGEMEEQWHTYALYYLALVEQAAPFLKNAQQDLWLAKLDQELDNLRNALQWLIQQKETELALRFAEAFGKFCGLCGYWHEEQSMLEVVLQLPATLHQEIRGKVQRRAGHLAYRRRNLTDARILLEQSVACSREAEDWQNLVGALSSLGWVLYRQNEIDMAHQLLKECVEVASLTDDYWVRANALESLGRFMHYQDKREEAYVLLQESVAISRAHLDKESLARILTTLANLEVSRGNKEQAMQLAQESFLLAQELNTKPLIALTLGTLGTVALFQGAYAQAKQYFEERCLIAEELGDIPTIAHIKLRLADIMLEAKDFAQAEQFLGEASGLFPQMGITSDIITAKCIMGDLKRIEGDVIQAKSLYQEALSYYNTSADKRKIGRSLSGLAQIFLEQDMIEQSTYLLGVAESCLKPYDMYTEQRIDFEQAKKRVLTFLGKSDFARLWKQGNTEELEQVLGRL